MDSQIAIKGSSDIITHLNCRKIRKNEAVDFCVRFIYNTDMKQMQNTKLFKHLCFNENTNRNAALGVIFIIFVSMKHSVVNAALLLQLIYYYSDDAC